MVTCEPGHTQWSNTGTTCATITSWHDINILPTQDIPWLGSCCCGWTLISEGGSRDDGWKRFSSYDSWLLVKLRGLLWAEFVWNEKEEQERDATEVKSFITFDLIEKRMNQQEAELSEEVSQAVSQFVSHAASQRMILQVQESTIKTWRKKRENDQTNGEKQSSGSAFWGHSETVWRHNGLNLLLVWLEDWHGE